MRYRTLLFCLLLSLAATGQEQQKSKKSFLASIDLKVPQLLEMHSVPGAALAIIEDGKIILQRGYGYADIQSGKRVDVNTGFNIGSVSKTPAAWAIMKLVEEGRIGLDSPAERYLTRWHLPKSEHDADEVTIRRLLSHTAGLSLHGYPGWSPKDTLPSLEESLNGKNNGPGRVEIIMEPGSRYKYSGGGFSILQLIVEEISGTSFEEYMQREVLDPLGMSNSSYRIDDEILASSSKEYDRYGGEISLELFTAQAAAGLHTTIEDFSKFALASMYQMKQHEKNNPVISAASLRMMMQPVPQALGRFGYGLGFMTEAIPGTDVFLAGHRGTNTGWHAIFSVNPKTNDGFVMLTNGGSGQQVYQPIFYDWILWELGVELESWYNEKPSIDKKINSIIDKEGIDQLSTRYLDIKKAEADKYDFSESKLNDLGYHFISKGQLEEALAVFKLNIDAFPSAYNTYDSYGEALLLKGLKEEAIENYRRSVKLNPGNENGIRVLQELGASTDDLIVSVPLEQLRQLAGEYVNIENVEWTIDIELKDGILFGNDRGYQFKMAPLGVDRFVNAENGSAVLFNTEDSEAITMEILGKFAFEKVE